MTRTIHGAMRAGCRAWRAWSRATRVWPQGWRASPQAARAWPKAARRAWPDARRAWIARLLLAAAGTGLAGCAAVASYEKCGRAGCAGDAAITADVHSLYRRHPSIEAPNLIDVQTLDGVVYLYGAVDTDMQRQLAEAVALEATGVKRVVNAIGIANLGR